MLGGSLSGLARKVFDPSKDYAARALALRWQGALLVSM